MKMIYLESSIYEENEYHLLPTFITEYVEVSELKSLEYSDSDSSSSDALSKSSTTRKLNTAKRLALPALAPPSLTCCLDAGALC